MLFGDSPISPKELIQELISGVRSHDGGKTWSMDRNKIWTDAVKLTMKNIGESRSAYTKCYYTKAEPHMKEFLLDLVWWDKSRTEGATLACECEWQFTPRTSNETYIKAVGEDFGKLLVFKAPLKLMIFASSDACPPGPIVKEINRYLKSYKHHVTGETYLAVDFVRSPKAWIARVDQDGAIQPKLSAFEI